MKNKREIQAIERTLNILDSPEKWIKGYRAKTKNDEATTFNSEDAVTWCVDGAICKALDEQKLTDRKWSNSYIKIVHAMCRAVKLKFNLSHQDEHIGFNDHENTTHEMIIDMLNRAKEFLQGNQKGASK